MSRQAPPNGVGFNVFPVAPATDPETLPCDACGAEPFEPCRYGCLGAVSEAELVAAWWETTTRP